MSYTLALHKRGAGTCAYICSENSCKVNVLATHWLGELLRSVMVAAALVRVNDRPCSASRLSARARCSTTTSRDYTQSVSVLGSRSSTINIKHDRPIWVANLEVETPTNQKQEFSKDCKKSKKYKGSLSKLRREKEREFSKNNYECKDEDGSAPHDVLSSGSTTLLKRFSYNKTSLERCRGSSRSVLLDLFLLHDEVWMLGRRTKKCYRQYGVLPYSVEQNISTPYSLCRIGVKLGSFDISCCIRKDKENRRLARLAKESQENRERDYPVITNYHSSSSEADNTEYSDSSSEEEAMEGDQERTLRQLANPRLLQQPLCIIFPTVNDATFELKSGLIHLLPSFNGLSGEDPHMHLKEFHTVCSEMKPAGVTEEQIKLQAFPFSWRKLFSNGTFRHHGLRICITEELLIQYFYEGLSLMDRNMLDAASGGTLMDKTPTAARDLIENMAANSQQFGTREASFQSVNEAGIGALESQVKELTTFVRKLAMNGLSRMQPCMRCETTDYVTDNCPLINGEMEAQANAIGSNNGPGQNYDPFSNTYNPDWRDHPNLRYGNPSGGVYAEKDNRPPQIFQRGQNFPRQAGNGQPNSMPQSSLEEMIKTLATSSMNFQQGVQESIKYQEMSIKNQEMNIQNQGLNIKSQGVSIKNLEGQMSQLAEHMKYGAEQQNTGTPCTQSAEKERRVGSPIFPPLKPEPLPFPSRVRKAAKEDAEKQVLDVFKKVEINIPLIDVIKQVPRYAKFLKDLCTNKRRLQGNEKVLMGENVSAIFQKDLPHKRSDPGMFSIPCTIGNLKIKRVMLDLGASINIMPRSIFDSLNLGPLKETRVVIQLADRSTTFPDGVIEDVLVKVNELIFPADFYVLSMNDRTPISTPILLGRPFLNTAQTKIDVREGTLTMEFDGNVIRFNIFDAMKFPESDHCVYLLDCIEPLAQDFLDTYREDQLELVISQSLDNNQTVWGTCPGIQGDPILGLQRDSNQPEFCHQLELIDEAVTALNTLKPYLEKHDKNFIRLPELDKKILPSTLQEPELELKSLPSHLKYAYLGDNRTLPVIVSSKLEPDQEAALIEVLKNYK
ncbi:retropepsin-like protein [Striga asiatica]|uniref:Retropepsin-like protein n=1 Tax=Striga asiatica TaxID=4170 RepID=A0A5A7PGL2_STRAF|nr:retropepsin-like protein [Striga asiatica]